MKLYKQYPKEYSVWAQMKNRCNSPKHPSYRYWGGKGITYDRKWETFAGFIDDMGPRPSKEYTLERRDGDWHYCLENCYWATRKQQSNNTSRNIKLGLNGRTQTLAQWGEELGIDYEVLRGRYRYGWDAERILTEPIQSRKCFGVYYYKDRCMWNVRPRINDKLINFGFFETEEEARYTIETVAEQFTS